MPQEELSSVLPLLCQTADERRHAVDATVELIANEDAWLDDALDRFSELVTSESERDYAVESLLHVIRPGAPHSLPALDALLTLDLSQQQERGVASAAIALLRVTDARSIPQVASRIRRLHLNERERLEAASVLADASATANPTDAVNLTQALVSIDPPEHARQQAKTALLDRLLSATGAQALELATAVQPLGPTEREMLLVDERLASATPDPREVTHRDVLRMWRERLPLHQWVDWLHARPREAGPPG